MSVNAAWCIIVQQAYNQLPKRRCGYEENSCSSISDSGSGVVYVAGICGHELELHKLREAVQHVPEAVFAVRPEHFPDDGECDQLRAVFDLRADTMFLPQAVRIVQ